MYARTGLFNIKQRQSIIRDKSVLSLYFTVCLSLRKMDHDGSKTVVKPPLKITGGGHTAPSDKFYLILVLYLFLWWRGACSITNCGG